MKRLWCLLLLLFSSLGQQALAQGEGNWWFYASKILHFTPAGVVAQPAVVLLDSEEGSASVSDAAGNLLFYTDGSTIWTRRHRPMPRGTGLGLSFQYSATQGALIVQDPGDAQRYYVFRQAAYTYPEGFGYVVVDMRLNDGLGDVVSPMRTLSLPGVALTEKLTGIVHANGRDTWVLVHGYYTNMYYAYLVSPAGVAASPVSTAVGVVHGRSGTSGVSGYAGCLRASPTGTKLACAVTRQGSLELLDFDPLTGRPSNAVLLGQFSDVYGVEFSADGSKLYASNIRDNEIYQYDLLAGAAAEVVRSQMVVGKFADTRSEASALQRGPDERIYVAQRGLYLGVIAQPNVRGAACGYQEKFLLAGADYGLPNFPNQFATPGRSFVRITAAAGCVASATLFSASVAPGPLPVGSVYTWTFGDPASGTANTATGPNPAHRYQQPGTYLVSLQVHNPAGTLLAQTTTIFTTLPALAVSLAPRNRVLCPGDSLPLTVNSLAGATYRWQDGTTGPAYLVRRPGLYRVSVTSAQGCIVQDSVLVAASPAPTVSLGPDTVLCSSASSLVLRPSPQAAGSTLRWQDGSSGPTYTASQPGTYWVEVRSASGCTATAQVVVSGQECALVIPNIITPNGDNRNDSWVLKGVQAAEWSVTLYTRWGKQVFATQAYDNGWQALGLPSGVYYYHLVHTTSKKQYKGWLEVVR
ncbi:gliding motility-associated C-terminal domain-containing protein [Hymenobacter sp. BT635]|uniref:Gliding motility-associated C-terminal domain-containing protein n=1 Tax=Hymenobacter nitidus TaxID=2880929 RepID=A0ABS8AKR7_9BACT|nr:gliding motility-associated C-terminal domain-containing protein [Hymenobacter nitidus]MCB2380466.1 gliding motility-associated C-terminal domain-containing protein [Hymenobacter nitidus]